jgi:hypothetical protein
MEIHKVITLPTAKPKKRAPSRRAMRGPIKKTRFAAPSEIAVTA